MTHILDAPASGRFDGCGSRMRERSKATPRSTWSQGRRPPPTRWSRNQGYKRIRIVHGLLVNLAELLFQLRDQCLKSFPGNEISSRSKVPGLHDLHFEFHALVFCTHSTQFHLSYL